jgi:prepilin-type N-terminal cleavage/methylation domain-containing protein
MRQGSGRIAGQGGFTLIELLVSLAITVLIILGVLELFDMNNKISRVQTNVAELQQSIRIGQYDLVRMARMTGRGGLPRGTLPGSLAFALRNNVTPTGDDHWIAFADNASPPVLPGTDVLTLRGVLSTPLYHFDPRGGALVLGPNGPLALNANEGLLTINNPNPWTGITQSLEPLATVIRHQPDPWDDALLIVGPLGNWVVVEIVAAESSVTPAAPAAPTQVVLKFRWTGGTHTAEYLALSDGGILQPTLRSVAAAGLLEEYRFYVREEHEIGPTTELTPRLSRARFLPGTEVPHPSNPGMADDIADNIFDLQLALAIDTDNNEEIDEGGIDEAERAADDWLFNAETDPPAADAVWNVGVPAPPPLYYLRITTLAHTDRRDPTYQATKLARVEDKDYTEGGDFDVDPYYRANQREELMFRRRLLTSIVDLRNL